jgi:hypothetical protein
MFVCVAHRHDPESVAPFVSARVTNKGRDRENGTHPKHKLLSPQRRASMFKCEKGVDLGEN